MIEAFLFDFDGVIFNSERIWYDAFNETLKQYKGTNITFEKFNEKCKGVYPDDYIPTFFGDVLADRFSLVKQTYKKNFLGLLSHSSLYFGVKELLEMIKGRGFKIAIVTQTDRDWLNGAIEYFGISKYFDVIVTGDMVTRRKPFPDSVLLACEKLKVKPENTVYIEDSPIGVEAGKAAGTMVVAVTHTSTKEELSEADYVITYLDELKRFM